MMAQESRGIDRDIHQKVTMTTAEELASEILRRHNVSGYPIPIERIAQNEGANVQYTQILCEGTLSRTEEGYVIRVNRNSPPHRRRFTIAHELGHIVFARLNLKVANTRQCSPESFSNGREEERFCDRFAASLLIPDNAITEFTEWKEISIQRLIRKAHELKVSIKSLIWRVVEQAPYEGGALWFRMMAKPTDPKDVKLRLEWGVFPKNKRMYLPRYDAVPKNSPIYQALTCPGERIYHNVKLDFGSLRGRRTLLMKAIGQQVLAIVLPKEISPNTMLPQNPALPGLLTDIR